jgi:DNA ligase (NAD+)
MDDTLKKISVLRKKIKKYNDLYYKKGISEISDFEYDLLLKELEDLERQNGQEYLFENAGAAIISPSMTVGSDLTEGFKKVRHKKKMLSITNSYSSSDLIEFDSRIKKLLSDNTEIEYCVEYKIDGLAVSLVYENGKLVYASTRGDGEQGDDITLNFSTIKGVPPEISSNAVFEVRGEIYISKSDFRLLNEIREKEGFEVLANPRNAAAGSVKLLDTEEVKKRPLRLICYYLDGEISKGTHSENIDLLREMGFPAIDYCNVCKNISEVISECEYWESRKNSLDYDIDGLVVKVNSLLFQQELGDTAKSPRWVMAYKFKPDRAETILKEILFQVGRTGAVTPVAVLEPVLLSGTIVKRATLHNFVDLKSKDLRPGDRVIIEKAGEIIPQIVEVNKDRRPENSVEFTMIDECPSCKEKLVKPEDEAIYRCVNASCPAQIERQIEHFASKSAMDISGMGPQMVKTLLSSGLIKEISDLYKLEASQLQNIERMGDISSKNLIESIRLSKNKDLGNLIYGLGIRQVGKEASISLARNFKDIDILISARYDEIVAISDLGQKTAESVVSFFSNQKNLELISKLKSYGVNTKILGGSEKTVDFFKDKVFVITGTLENIDREELKDLINLSKGKVSSTVGKSTDYLICGKSPGSKYEKAIASGVEIISEEKLNKILNNEI